MNFGKKSLILFSLILMSLFVGCGSSDEGQNKGNTAENNSSRADNKLVFANFRDIRDLNPHLYAGEMYAQEIIFESLISLTPEGYAPCLAESWEISEDGRSYTFYLRKGVVFSDGEPFNAEAVEANFNALIENRERHTWLEMMRLLESVEVVDEFTFRINMEDSYYPMLTELAVTRPFRFISPKAMKDGSTKDGVLEYIGTGPYVLKEFVTDEYAVFKRNEKYWGEAPAIEEILVKVIPDNQTRILALERGEIDLIYGTNMIDAEAINKYRTSDRFNVALSDPVSTRQILFNSTNEILKDRKVRQALQHAIDRVSISEGIFLGTEAPAETLYAKTVPYANIDLKPYEYDLDKAAAMLEEAGWVLNGDVREKDGMKFDLNLNYNSDNVTERSISEFLQSEFAKIGVVIHLTGEEEQSYRDNMKNGNFDIVFNIAWGLPYDPQSSLAAMRQRVYGDYEAQLGLSRKKEIDKAITEILTSTDEVERQELYKFVLTELHESAVYIPITYESNKAVFTSDLENVLFTQTQYEVPFEKMNFKENN